MADRTGYPRLNPLRVRIGRDSQGFWSGNYARRNRAWSVSGFGSRGEVLDELRRFVGMRVVKIDGKFVEAPRALRWWQR